MGALNHKRVAKRMIEVAGKEVEKIYRGLASSLQLGVMFAKTGHLAGQLTFWSSLAT